MSDNKCSYCLRSFEGEVRFSIHADGFGEGEEVPLCADCGGTGTPSCEEIWETIAARKKAARDAYYQGEHKKLSQRQANTTTKPDYWKEQ